MNPNSILLAKDKSSNTTDKKLVKFQKMTTLPDVQIEPHPHSIGGHQNLAGVRRIIELRIQKQNKSLYLHSVSFTSKKAGTSYL